MLRVDWMVLELLLIVSLVANPQVKALILKEVISIYAICTHIMFNCNFSKLLLLPNVVFPINGHASSAGNLKPYVFRFGLACQSH